MTYEEALAKAKDMVNTAKEVVIITRGNPSMDSMGPSLALMLGVISLGKKATVVCPDPMTVGLSGFVGVDRVVRDFGKRNFVISLDYEDGSIEKVSYNIEGKKFNLVVEHRPGFELLDKENVQYSYQGVSADLIITVDTQNFGQLGAVYTTQKDIFAKTPIINVDRHNENVNYGVLNLVDPGASTTTELVAELLATVGVKLTADIATNLLNAVYDATGNFQNANVTSMAFEVASVCLKAGGKRFGLPAQVPQQQTQAPQITATPEPVVQDLPTLHEEKHQAAGDIPSDKPEPVREPQIFIGNRPVTPAPHVQPVGHAPSAAVTPQAAAPTAKPAQPPSDWLKPKIFKSSGTLV